MKNFISKHSTEIAYNDAQGIFDLPHVALIEELIAIGNAVRYLEQLHKYSQNYFTIVSLEDNNTIGWKTSNSSNLKTISVSTDDGQTWTNKESSTSGTVLATLNNGDKLLIKGNNTAYGAVINSVITNNYFTATQNFDVEGNIMSLLYGDNFIGETSLSGKEYAFVRLFYHNNYLVNAQNLKLPATTLAHGCYDYMFGGCSSLTTAPVLPATTLVGYCYSYMFFNCTSLTTAPILPATTLAYYCYESMFSGCSSLTSAPELPVTTLADHCYYQMFYGCTSLTTAPALPATTLTNYCYYMMFSGCRSLTTTPTLHATTLATGCYGYMFRDCTSLTTAPALPATTLANHCYYSMFEGCTGLTTAPALPATTLADYCYYGMFNGCTSLTTAPALPATTLANYCYYLMFNGCSSLTTVSALPATILADYCYYMMFRSCTLLTTAPELPATTLTTYCYYCMFNGCTSLNYIKCLATDISASSCTTNWVSGVATIGTFVKDPDYNNLNWTLGNNGIPENWVVENTDQSISCWWNSDIISRHINDTTNKPQFINPNNISGFTFSSSNLNIATIDSSGNITYVDEGTCTLTASFSGNNNYEAKTFTCTLNILPINYSLEYFTIVSLENNNTIKWQTSNESFLKTISISIDDGQTWTTKESSINGTILATLNNGDKLLIKGSNVAYGSSSNFNSFSSTGNFNVQGNISSLRHGDNFITYSQIDTYSFRGLFRNCNKLINANNLILPATSVYTGSYYHMFYGCTSLLTTPKLPAKNLDRYCYSYMFYGCTSLVYAPELPATTLKEYCYYNMFSGCTSLRFIKCLATNISASSCTTNWVYNVPQYDGIFIKASNMSDWTTGNNGIPTYWEIMNDNQAPLKWSQSSTYSSYSVYLNSQNELYLINPLNLPVTFSSSNSNIVSIDNLGNITYVNVGTCILTASFVGDENYDPVSLQITIEVNPYNYSYGYMGITPLENGTISFSKTGLYYSTDDGTTWTSLPANTNINVTISNNILFKGTPTPGQSASTFGIGSFSSSNNINVFGNINSLLYGDNYQSYNTTQLKYAAFTKLFYNCTHLIDASNLILPYSNLNYVCYESMFEGCSSLIKAPKLRTTSVLASDSGYHVYYAMFKNCISLEEAPEIRLETINTTSADSRPLANMFDGCSSLKFIKLLVTSGHSTFNLYNWVYGVAATGIFIKADNVVWETGASGIPTGWTVYDESDYHDARLEWSSNTYTAILGTTYNYPTLSNPNNLTVTYSSSDTSIATIDSSGNITLTNNTGSTTISAIFAGDNDYDPVTITYTLTITKANANISWSTNSITITDGIGYTLPTFSNPNNLTVTFSSSDTSVATIDSSGNILLVGLGNTTISATFAGNSNYNSSIVSYQLTYQEYQKENPTLQWSVATYSLFINETYNGPTLSVTSGLTITYSSSNTNVANIDSSGNVTILSEGTTTITASFAGNQYYNSASDSYTLTVSKVNPNIAWSTNSTSVLLNNTFNAPTLSNPNNLTITYTSSDTSVATINSSTGEVTILDEGTTTISASFVGNNIYNASTVTYTLNVLSSSGVTLDWGTDGSKEVSANPNASYATPLSCGNPAPSVPLISGYGGITSFQPVMLDSSSPYCIENGASAIIARNNYSSISFSGESSNALTILNTLANDSDVKYAYAWISGYTFGRYDGSTKFCAPKNTTIQAAMVINANAMHTSRVISTTSSSKIWIYGNSTITTSTDGRSAIAPFSGQVDALHAAGNDLMLVIAYKFN